MAEDGYVPSTVARPVSVHWLPLFVLVAAGYAAGSELAFSWFGADGTSASFFPAAGVTFAALALVTRRQWPIVLLAAGLAEVLIDLSHDIALPSSLGYAVANVAQPLAGALLLVALVPRRIDIGRTRELATFVATGVVIGPAVGGILGASTFVFVDGGEGWLRFAGQWWVGDGLGVLVVGGAILSRWSRAARAITRQRVLETIILAAVGVLSALAVLRLHWFAFVYLPVALLGVMAFRVGTRGVAAMGAAIAIAVAEATAKGHTFWDSLEISPPAALVYLQLGMAVVIVSALALAAEISERERIARALARSETERATAADRAALYDAERSARRRAEQLEQHTSDLQVVTAALAAANTTQDVTRVTLTRYIPLIGGLGGAIFTVDETHGALRMAEHDPVPSDVIDAHRVISLDEELPEADAARTAEPVLLRNAGELRTRYPHAAETPKLADPAHARAWAHLPLMAGGHMVGVLRVAFPEPQAFDAAQRNELATGAAAIALALQRSRLFELEQRARQRAELLERNAAHLAAAVSVQDVARSTIADLEAAGVDIAVLGVVHGDTIETIGASGIPAAAQRQFTRFPLSEQSLLTETIRRGEAVEITSAEEYDLRYPTFAPTRRAVGVQAFIGVPLMGEARTPLGALVISAADPVWLDDERRGLVSAIAEQTATALGRALLFQAERDARERAELLERHAMHLADADTLVAVAEATAGDLAAAGIDIAVVAVVEDGAVRILAAAGLPDELLRARPAMSIDTPAVVTDTIRSGTSILVNSGDDYDRRFPELAGLRASSGVESVLSIPLRAEGGVLGALVAGSRTPDWIDDRTRLVVDAVATQCGAALERAQLRERVHADAASAQLLAELGELLEQETTVARRARRVVDHLVANHAVSATVELEGDARLEVTAGDPTPTGAVRTVTLPLRSRGRSLGSLSVALGTQRRDELGGFDLRAVAERAALAIDNAQLYERERDVSHSLQMSLLGPMGTASNAVDVASAYLPGTTTLDVGGDWCDAFELPEGRLAFVVGDVVGHGLEAAMAMGQLRGAVRALAPIGTPVEVLRNLDAFVGSVPEACMATLAYAELDVATGRLVYATAGHPPPLVAAPAGAARLLWGGRSAPLGAAAGTFEREEAEDVLEPGELLLLYTDGLIERRGEGLDAMLDRLQESAGLLEDDTPQTVVDRVLGALLDEDANADDVCVLALVRTGDRFRLTLPATRQDVSTLRHALDSWLAGRGVDVETSRELVLAVAEATANAVEHGYAFDGVGVVEVDVRVDARSLSATISDRGRWRAPSPDPSRGRGTTIMRALMEDVVVDGRPSGTTVRMRARRRPSVHA